MQITDLKLRNFRNYADCEVLFHPGLNFIAGRNAQGKTNLLESLIYLSLTRSHRVIDDRKLIRYDQGFADIRCSFVKDRKKHVIESVITPKGKTLLVQKTPVHKSSEFIGQLNVILFSPDDLRIFADPPKERRRLINQEITKISNRYLICLNRYQALLKQRNLFLKQNHTDRMYLDTLSEQMSVEEAVIVNERIQFCHAINTILSDLYISLSGDQDTHVEVIYKCCYENTSKQYIADMHKASTNKDIENRVTVTGIHRDDLIFLMNGRNLSENASQGQKRMTMLAFKLALHRYIKKVTGEDAVLLLDDVLSELDPQKQKRLISLVSTSSQCILTAAHVPSFMMHTGIHMYVVENGTVRQEDFNERSR